MWVQFRDIPFHLLTKKLARTLGEEIGNLIMIDNNSRGSIFDKFLRARVQLPLYTALQRWATLEDVITGEEVKVQIRYERLPNFCLFCGFIGHMEARCDLPVEGRRLNYSQELRVPAVHFDDPRSWFLPEAMGQPCNQSRVEDIPWRAAKPAALEQGEPSSPAQHIAIAQVADDVAKLSMGSEKANPDGISARAEIIAMITDKPDAYVEGVSLAAADGGNKTPTTTNATMVAMGTNLLETDTAGWMLGVAPAAPRLPVSVSPTEQGNLRADVAATNSTNLKTTKGWKRQERAAHEEPKVQSGTDKGASAGAVRQRQEEDDMGEPALKRPLLAVPSLSECLGSEGLRMIRNLETEDAESVVNVVKENESKKIVIGDEDDLNHAGLELGKEDKQGKEGGNLEATGHGAAGILSGAIVGTRQET
jgi:hypothetical protein